MFTLFSRLIHQNRDEAIRSDPSMTIEGWRTDMVLSTHSYETLLKDNERRLNALQQESGFNGEQFKQLIWPLVAGVARYVHSLPATRSLHHHQEGGLFSYALESAFLSFRRADAKLFSHRIKGQHRNRADIAWRYATFVAALCAPIGRAATYLKVAAPGIDQPWDPYQQGLSEWIEENNCAHVAVMWEEASDAKSWRLASLWLTSQLLTPEIIRYLNSIDHNILLNVMMFIGDSRGKELELGRIISEAVTAVEKSFVTTMQEAGSNVTGIAVEHRVMDAIRALIKAKWSINEPGARLWVSNHGVFLVWRSAFMDIQLKLNSAGLKGVPEDASTLGIIMLDKGGFYANPYKASGNRHIYKIRVNAPRIPKAPLEAVRLADPEDLGIDMSRYEPLEVELLDKPEERVVGSGDEEQGDDNLTMELPLEAASQLMLDDQIPPPNSEYEDAAPHYPEDDQAESTTPSSETVEVQAGGLADKGNTTKPIADHPHDKPVGAFKRLGILGPPLMKLSEDIKSGKWQSPEVRTLDGELIVSFPYVIRNYTDNPQEFLKQCKVRNLIDREYREKVKLNNNRSRELQFIVFNKRYSHLISSATNVI